MGDPFDHLRGAMLPSGQMSAEELEELARLAKGCLVLEVGSGWSTVAMARTGASITSIDIQPRFDVAAALANALSAETCGQISLVCSDSRTALPNTPSRSYDGVFIDGDHAYGAALNDILEAKRIARRWIAVHDYDPRFPGVVRAFGQVLGSPERIVGVLAILNATAG